MILLKSAQSAKKQKGSWFIWVFKALVIQSFEEKQNSKATICFSFSQTWHLFCHFLLEYFLKSGQIVYGILSCWVMSFSNFLRRQFIINNEGKLPWTLSKLEALQVTNKSCEVAWLFVYCASAWSWAPTLCIGMNFRWTFLNIFILQSNHTVSETPQKTPASVACL